MSPETIYWTKLGIIALIDVAVFVWIYREVRRVDREQEAAEVRKLDLQAQIKRSKLIMLSLPEHEQQRLQRTAEAMGFMDGAA